MLEQLAYNTVKISNIALSVKHILTDKRDVIGNTYSLNGTSSSLN